MIKSCKDNKNVFNKTFQANSYIMDFWNNKIGRDYGSSSPNSKTTEVFTSAWNGNKLIKNEATDVTTAKRNICPLCSNSWAGSFQYYHWSNCLDYILYKEKNKT